MAASQFRAVFALCLVASSLGCSYWCKTPEGSAYCCQQDSRNPNTVGGGIGGGGFGGGHIGGGHIGGGHIGGGFGGGHGIGGGFGGLNPYGPSDNPKAVHPGTCPPVRRQCPNTRFGGPPRTCAYDGACGRTEKCCFDRCLKEHVCKPVKGGFGGFGGAFGRR